MLPTYVRCVHKMSATTSTRPAHLRRAEEEEVRSRWKVWQNPFKPLKNSSTYFAFLHSLNEGISPFWFCFLSCSGVNFLRLALRAQRSPFSTPFLYLSCHCLAISFPLLRPCGGIKGFTAYQVINIYKRQKQKLHQQWLTTSWTSNWIYTKFTLNAYFIFWICIFIFILPCPANQKLFGHHVLGN